MNHRFLTFGASVAAVIVLAVPTPASAAGAEITAVGWWSQRPGAAETPKGGFELALGPGGPLSQAALRVRVDAVQLTSALVEMTESEAAGAEVAAVNVCTTSENWSAANAGAWDEAPAPNCQRSEPMVRSLSGTWTADVSELLTVGDNSLVLVPGSHPDTQGAPVPYRLVFEEATLEASAAVEPAPTPPPSTTDEPATTRSGDPPVTEPVATDVGEPPPLEPVTPAPSDPVVAVPSFIPDTEEDPGTSRPWSRLVILVPLAAAIGVTTVVGRRALRDRGVISSG